MENLPENTSSTKCQFDQPRTICFMDSNQWQIHMFHSSAVMTPARQPINNRYTFIQFDQQHSAIMLNDENRLYVIICSLSKLWNDGFLA